MAVTFFKETCDARLWGSLGHFWAGQAHFVIAIGRIGDHMHDGNHAAPGWGRGPRTHHTPLRSLAHGAMRGRWRLRSSHAQDISGLGLTPFHISRILEL